MSNQGKKVKTHYRGTLDSSIAPTIVASRWSSPAVPVR